MSLRSTRLPHPAATRLLAVASAASATGIALASLPAAALAAGTIEPPSTIVVQAAPEVTRPDTRSCTVTLASHFLSNTATGAPQNFSGTFTPPANCRGPWAKVVLDSTTSVSGRQYDRSGSITLGGATIWFGTTQEPSGATPTTYHFAKDVTKFSALFRSAQPYQGGIVNYMSSVYTGNYDQTVTLTFYMADRRHPAPRVPDKVVGVPVADIRPGRTTATTTLTNLPTNIIQAELETTLKGNGCDEQWFTAVPDSVATQFPSAGMCAAGPYREARVSVDDTLVGAVGTYPHIYSGGIVPTLWRPVLAIDTLDMRPESLDITPLAGTLTDGGSHTVSYAIDPVGDNWNVVSNLFLYTDPHRAHTTGQLLVHDVSASPSGTTDAGAVANRFVDYSQTAHRHDTLSGYVMTSRGKVTTTVTTTRDYRNTGHIRDDGMVQTVQQSDVMATRSVSTVGRHVVRSTTLRESYPLSIDFSAAAWVDDQNFSLEATVHQGQQVASVVTDGFCVTARAWNWTVDSYGILSRANGVTSESDGHSTTSYIGTDDAGRFHRRTIVTNHGAVVSDTGR